TTLILAFPSHSADHLQLPSFPTRRSSDLACSIRISRSDSTGDVVHSGSPGVQPRKAMTSSSRNVCRSPPPGCAASYRGGSNTDPYTGVTHDDGSTCSSQPSAACSLTRYAASYSSRSATSE